MPVTGVCLLLLSVRALQVSREAPRVEESMIRGVCVCVCARAGVHTSVWLCMSVRQCPQWLERGLQLHIA